MKPTIYLAGAIRDGNAYDFEWRNGVREKLQDHFHVMSPLAGKTYHDYDDGRRIWSMHGAQAPADMIVPRDLHMIHKADFILANLTPLAEGYPSIGTLMELGIALERRILTVVVGSFAHCEHPFIKCAAYRRVADLGLATDWLLQEAATWAR